MCFQFGALTDVIFSVSALVFLFREENLHILPLCPDPLFSLVSSEIIYLVDKIPVGKTWSWCFHLVLFILHQSAAGVLLLFHTCFHQILNLNRLFFKKEKAQQSVFPWNKLIGFGIKLHFCKTSNVSVFIFLKYSAG